MAGFGTALPTPYAVGWYLTPEVGLALAAGITGSMPLWPVLGARVASREQRLGPLASAVTCAALAAIFAGCAMLIAAHTYNPFIYFRF
jgi:alginate O-acetyltransferase complex protein AlgI